MLSTRQSNFSKFSHAAWAQVAALASLACAAIMFSAPANAQECASIITFGGNGNGVANNSPAFASAVAALPANGGCIAFPAGRYLFSTALTLNYPASGIYSVTLLGGGSENTTLYFPSSNGLSVNSKNARQTIHIRDLTFTTGSAGGYSALTVTNSLPLGTILQSDIFRTTFRGDDGGATTEYWSTGVNVVGQSNINFDSDMFVGRSDGSVGTGINLNGNTSASPNWGIVYNVAKCGFFWTGVGIEVGTYIQGISVTQSNFTNGNTGVLATAGGTGLTELAITGGNQFNTTGNQIEIRQAIQFLILSGNLFFVESGSSGIYLDATGQQNTIVNNAFFGLSNVSNGIYVAASNPNTVLIGNVFTGLGVGLNLTGTSGWNVQANTFQSDGTNVANVGTNSVGVATP